MLTHYDFPFSQLMAVVDGCCYAKQEQFFYKFYNFFFGRHSLMKEPCYHNLFQTMQHDNFQNLNRVNTSRVPT